FTLDHVDRVRRAAVLLSAFHLGFLPLVFPATSIAAGREFSRPSSYERERKEAPPEGLSLRETGGCLARTRCGTISRPPKAEMKWTATGRSRETHWNALTCSFVRDR